MPMAIGKITTTTGTLVRSEQLDSTTSNLILDLFLLTSFQTQTK